MKSKRDRNKHVKTAVKAKGLIQSIAIPADIYSDRAIAASRHKTKPSRGGPSNLDKLLKRASERVGDNAALMDLLPDMELLQEIIVSGIMSPKDMMTNAMNLSLTPLRSTDVRYSTDLEGKLREFFTTDGGYNIKAKVQIILEEALFRYGSYTLVCLPVNQLAKMAAEENARDADRKKMYGATEKVTHGYQGIMGTAPRLITGDTIDFGITVTEDATYLGSSNVDTATADRFVDVPGFQAMFDKSVLTLMPNGADAVDGDTHPMVIKIPADALLPVVNPYEVDEPVGYWVPISPKTSMPITRTRKDRSNKLLDAAKKAGKDGPLGDMFKVSGLATNKSKLEDVDNEELFINFERYLDTQLARQLNEKGAVGEELEVGSSNDVYRSVFRRTLKSMETRFLYLPAELVTCVAVKYTADGMGKSLLEAGKTYGILRAVLLFSRVMASVKNSVGRTRLEITLEEDEENPSETIEAILQNYAGYQSDMLPMGSMSMPDIAQSLRRAGVEVAVDGGDNWPNTKTDIVEAARSGYVPDESILEELTALQYKSFALDPNILEDVISGDTATRVLIKNNLLTKILVGLSTKVSAHLTRHVRQYTRASGVLTKIVRDSLEGSATSADVLSVINSITVTLPEPDGARIESHTEVYEKYSSMIDDVVEAHITEDMMSELMDGDIDSGVIESLQISVAAHLKREWMRKQNVMNDVTELLSDTKGLASAISSHNNDIFSMLKPVLLRAMKGNSKLDKAAAKLEDKLSNEEEDNEDTESSGNESTDETGGGEPDDTNPPDETGGGEPDDTNPPDETGGDGMSGDGPPDL